MESPTEQIDYARAGYPSQAAFDAAWGAAIDTLGNRLRRLAGPTVLMVGNCAQSTNYQTFNGWMRENFPFQDGGDWYQNMFRVVGGYLPDDANFRPPPSNYLFSAMIGTDPYSGTNTRRVRFGLGSAALGSGFAVFGPSAKTARPEPYHMYWYDEYAVDPSGRSSASLQYTGWLGQPLGPYSQMIWLGATPDVVTNPDFESDVTSGWTFGGSLPATISRDTTTAAVGSASAHVNVAAAGDPRLVVFGTTGTMSMSVSQPYSATFWARASVPRAITIAGGMLAETRIPITASWRQYQITLVAIGSGSAPLEFFLGETTGDVWLDDVHFQAGVSNVYRRDFQNGIVLVNPAAQPMTVTLERNYRKILGTSDPVTNDGSTVAQVTVNPSDAQFLIGDDHTPPAAIQDLQPGPAWSPRTTRAKRHAEAGAKKP
jgi:hypothetical protein